MNQSSGTDIRKQLIRGCTLVGGLYFFLEYLLPESVLKNIGVADSHEQISNAFIVIGVMAVGLGIFNLLTVHGTKIAFRRPGWINSIALLGGLVAMMAVTIGSWGQGLVTSYEVRRTQMLADFALRIVKDAESSRPDVPAVPVRVSALLGATAVAERTLRAFSSAPHPSLGAGSALRTDFEVALDGLSKSVEQLSALNIVTVDSVSKPVLESFAASINGVSVAYGAVLRKESESSSIQRCYGLLYDGLFIPLGSAMFALLGVYIASAAYRAFRVRSLESGLMMIAAVLVMLGQISFGVWIYHGMPDIRQWLLEVPNSAAFRAIRLGASIAGLMLAIRMWLSIESSSFADKKR